MSWQETREQRRPPVPIQKAVIPAARPATLAPKPAEPNYLGPLLGKQVAVRLMFGDSISGTLHGFSKYEIVVVEGNGTKTIVLKNAIATIGEAKP